MKNIFKAEHLLACSGLLLLLGGCTPDPLELDNATTSGVAMQAPKGGGNDDEVGSMSFILMASTQLPADLEAQVAAAGGTLQRVMPEVGLAVVKANMPGFAEKAAAITGIRSVLPDLHLQWIPTEDQLDDSYLVQSPPFTTDDDPFFNLQWGHSAIDAPEAWAAGYKGEGAVVAVLDTGFDTDHPDLDENVLHGLSMSFVPGESVVFDPALRGSNSSHGSHVAGTIAAADNGVGIIGVAPESKLMLVKVLSDKGSGAFSWIINGIVYAANNDADVINMSLGAALPRDGRFVNKDGSITKIPSNLITDLTVVLQRAITYASQKGALVIAAAGNAANDGQSDGSRIYVPSDMASVLSISATGPIGWIMNPATDLDVLASYSNYGNKVDFAAPGGNFDLFYQIGRQTCDAPVLPGRPCYAYDMVFSLANNGWSWSAGTSMASPHAAGVAALVYGKLGANANPAQVTAVMKQSADDIFATGHDPLSGNGRVNAFRAVTQ
jgi:subtilisin family serine protease